MSSVVVDSHITTYLSALVSRDVFRSKVSMRVAMWSRLALCSLVFVDMPDRRCPNRPRIAWPTSTGAVAWNWKSPFGALPSSGRHRPAEDQLNSSSLQRLRRPMCGKSLTFRSGHSPSRAAPRPCGAQPQNLALQAERLSLSAHRAAQPLARGPLDQNPSQSEYVTVFAKSST